ncbi:sister chromatid cohesion 1 protein 4 isoform X1 [Canna indica]|uniref:Sister chromatid cohesion 1 protein 4 isoform X1 n=1 Tax=Canna indica TaxID=4628 RepID=A0AAQ3QCV8_9LILI|nr:sister chromatid cohesion 1 protein 4 isoform X1 [Canna indica]
MFYSQFILAKKGPLGTIWIAAHLERKLRKNQVADTDIGVSVDSILFPEVPIALRLSSHLLLGVVRIYSRKVNYLFHDCSEALLKIKQAFRSTAVDLPPEESTAPYHSITLPETFHLDDFELPDSATQGDFIDHHVSTKEQITLQDTMDGTGYSTMQFGLDERFGDGNASQIGLDLDEDLFLEDNHTSSQHVQDDRSADQGQSSYAVPLTHMDIDDNQFGLVKDIVIEESKDLSNPSMVHVKKDNESCQWQGYNIQTPDLNEVFSSNDHIEGPSAEPSQIVGSTAHEVPNNFAECAHAPSTPGLDEEMFSANIHESPALSPHQKLSPPIGEEAVKPESSNLSFGHPDPVTNDGIMHDAATVTNSESVMQVVSSPNSELSERREQITAPDVTQMGCGQNIVSMLQNGYVTSSAKDVTVDEQGQENGKAIVPQVVQNESLICPSDSNCEAHLDKSQVDAEVQVISELPADNLAVEGVTSFINCTSFGTETQQSSCCSTEHIEDLHFIPCNSQVNQTNGLFAQDVATAENMTVFSVDEPGVSSQRSMHENKLHTSESSFEVQDKDFHMANPKDAEPEVQENPENVLTGLAELVSNTNEFTVAPSQKDDQCNQNSCPSSEYLEPEKMMLAPSANADQANELSLVTEEKGVIESDGSVNRMTSLSGKKRRLMEITPALENDHSEKMSDRSRLRKNSENVPDDDDLLASILVGKRTPLLKIGPTPPQPRIASLKRPGLAPRSHVLKRKVLMDDTTVLHADAIRQQLMNTEDIRRMRKKAPCTRTEVWMIQKNSLEDEIFNEPIMTGMSAQLNDINIRIPDFETDQKNSFNKPPKEFCPEIAREAAQIEPIDLLIRSENVEGETPGPSHVSLPTEAQSSKDIKEGDDHQHSEPSLPPLEQSGNSVQCTMLMTEISEKDEDAGVHTPLPSALPALSSLECEQLADDLGQTRNNSSMMGDEAQHSESVSARDVALADGDSKERMVVNDAFASMQQVADDLGQTRNNSSMMGDEAQHSESVSARDVALADGDSKERMVVNDAFAVMNDTRMHIEDRDADTDAPIMNRSMESIDVTAQNDPQDVCAVAEGVNGEIVVSELDNISGEAEAGLALDLTTATQGDMSFQDEGQSMLGAKADNENLVQPMNNEEILNTDIISSEWPGMDSTSSAQGNTETENVPSAVGESSTIQEFNIEGGMVGSTSEDLASAKEYSDFFSEINNNDTEFLNVDDEADYHEEGDTDVPNAENEALDNSGWSSRTRGVARYLKALFDGESGRERESIAMDRLIAGKTRKEASRMFFETLVLKTKDYIHVEQENPADYITIRPRAKLLKSEL